MNFDHFKASKNQFCNFVQGSKISFYKLAELNFYSIANLTYLNGKYTSRLETVVGLSPNGFGAKS